MGYAETELLVKRLAPLITDGFLQAGKARNEAELRTAATRIIEGFALQAGLELDLREEYTLVNGGRADAVYNRLVIEYEPPRSLRGSNSHANNKHAIGQVERYIEGLVRGDGRKDERLVGVAFDGCRFIFVRGREGTWREEEPLDVCPPATERFLRTLASLSTERALIPENLVEDFGEGSPAGAEVVGALYTALAASIHPRVNMLFEQWSEQFSEVCDYDQASRADVAQVAHSYGIVGRKAYPFKLFFCIHTYYALLIKLLASQVAHFYLAPKLGTGLKGVGSAGPTEMLKYLRELEEGELFNRLGISNFLEGDFFGWYVDVWSHPVQEGVRGVINKLADYSLVTLDVDPDTTRDLLKHLYQDLMPKQLRHNLGEYYTPDWLAQRLLNQLGGGKFVGDPSKRLLDPACGSGTFLVLAIKAMREYAANNSVPEPDLLDMILKNVVGFDLNPLAVISARTNYLLALGDLVQHRKGPISLPVYLCDSILTPSTSADLFGHGVSFNTAVGRFAVPQSLVEAGRIEALASLLEDSVGLHRPAHEFELEAIARFALDADKNAADLRLLVGLYERMLDLEARNVNGIWARIIKNAFAPLFQGQFDFVAGNPPWVNWESLPEQYRKETKPLWAQYGLFTLSGHAARLGGGKKDISMLMFYASADRYLKPDGLIGFIITQTVFKTEGGGDGFRRFMLGKDGESLRVMFVDDMSAIKPFEGAANRTAVLIARKGISNRYPVQVSYWRKRVKGSSLPESADLEAVLKDICRVSQWVAEPVDDDRPESPWITGRPKSIRAVKRLVAPSTFKAREGCNTGGLNGAYWVERIAERPDRLVVIANCGDIGKIAADNVQRAVEPESVYALLRGQDVSPLHAEPSLRIILAQDETAPASRAVEEDQLRNQRPKTLEYFAYFRDKLKERSGYKKYLSDQPYYAVYNCGNYVFSPWKLVWREQAAFLTCAVVGPVAGRPVVPDHKLMLVPCATEAEAHFLCGVLSSSVAAYIVASYGLETSTTTHVLKYVPVPTFDPAISLHQQISEASRAAHESAREDGPGAVSTVQAGFDLLVAELWRLSKPELKDIQDSLADLAQ